jgi:hypothetical protein
MSTTRTLLLVAALSFMAQGVWAADIILNEYNAVDSNDFLGGGDAAMDDAGGRSFDTYFGRVMGNGGDWFELVVIKDHLNMRGWQLDVYNSGTLDKTLTLTQHAIWSDLRAGTIITVAEDVPSDISYDPAAGDWWINVQANNNGDGLYIEKSSFPVSATNWQLRIRNAAGQVVFGPAGEGISPATGISGTEICRLEGNPSATVVANSTDYDDGDDFSTFGAPNRWGSQSFSKLRPVITPAAASISLTAPNAPSTVVDAGDIMVIKWTSTGITESVFVEFSIDAGATWSPVYPPNVGNTGQYRWVAPLVNSDLCLVRVSSSTRLSVNDMSDTPFTILANIPVAGLTGDFAGLVSTWLE